MLTRSAIPAVLVLALGLSACSSIYVEQDYDPRASFDGLRTFAWREFTASDAARGIANPLAAATIRQAAAEALTARGFVESPASPDFTVGGLAVVNERVDVAFVDDAWGYSRGAWQPTHLRTWVTTYDEGTLVIDVADGRTGAPLWRGTATAIVDREQTPEERHARLREAVTKVLAQFPPK